MAVESVSEALSDEELRYWGRDVSFFLSWASITTVIGERPAVDEAAARVASAFNPQVAGESVPTLKQALAINGRNPLLGVSDEAAHHRVNDSWSSLEDTLRLQMQSDGIDTETIDGLVGDLHQSALHSSLGLVCVPHALRDTEAVAPLNATYSPAA